MHALSVAFLAIVIASPQADDAAVSSLKQGDRLRVESRSLDAICIFQGVRDDTLMMRIPGGDAIEKLAFTDLDRLEVSLGQRSRWLGARRGFTFGLLSGAAVGAVMGLLWPEGNPDRDFFYLSKDQAGALLGIGLGLVGGLVGAVIGTIHPGEEWQRIDLDKMVGIGLDESGAVRMYITTHF
jgi:hypothetical protein